jgi:hypothetical protein
MISKPFVSALLLSLHSTVSRAVDIRGFPRTVCDQNRPVAICQSINPGECCVFPTGGLIAQAAGFSFVQCTDLVVYYYPDVDTEGSRNCGVTRDSAAAVQGDICLTAAPNGQSPGGGAAWFAIPNCREEAVRMTDAQIADMGVDIHNCTQQQPATLYGWPDNDDGVYELSLSLEQMEDFNQLGATEDNAKYIEMLQQFDATYHPNATKMANFGQLTYGIMA